MIRALCLIFFLGTTLAAADDQRILSYDEHGKRDPFSPLVSSNGAMISYDSQITATDINLEGVVIDAQGNNLAIMNGKVVKVGDEVGGYSVEVISNDHVDILKGSERLTVKIKKGEL